MSTVKVAEDILQVCYSVMDERGYEYDKNEYSSVRLGNDIDYVNLFEGIDKAALDEDDILVQFEVMRIVTDAETNEALGSIPYV